MDIQHITEMHFVFTIGMVKIDVYLFDDVPLLDTAVDRIEQMAVKAESVQWVNMMLARYNIQIK